MATKNGTAVMLFTRDLRTQDNLAFLYCLRNYRTVIPLFCFDPVQVHPQPYRSTRAIQFMIRSVIELNEALKSKLHIVYMATKDAIQEIRKYININAIVCSKDYTPFAKHRAEALGLTEVENHMLNPNIRNGSGQVYKVFTPFYNRSKSDPTPRPKRLPKEWHKRLKMLKLKSIIKPKTLFKTILGTDDLEPCILQGGRKEGLRLLRSVPKKYAETRNNPSLKTSMLSPHHKFGTISVRETYWAITMAFLSVEGATAYSNPNMEALIRQLYWRDFYYHISEEHPRIYQGPFNVKFAGIKWKNSRAMFRKWCEGRTGVPFVDAGMRQLLQEGWMHNRLRMIVAGFLCKDLHIDWRWGEKYFATQLVDYDPAQNNGGWQWAAGTGTDASPYFRIMNPWTQSKRFDPQGTYIRKYVPELKDMPSRDLHNPKKHTAIVDHAVARKQALDLYSI